MKILDFLIFVIVIILPFNLHAQDKLPDWLFNIPQSTEDILYSFGISDPGMSKDEGRKQAIERGKIMASFIYNMQINGTADSMRN